MIRFVRVDGRWALQWRDLNVCIACLGLLMSMGLLVLLVLLVMGAMK